MLAHICDFGDRINFEIKLANEGFKKIYQSPMCDSETFIRADNLLGDRARLANENTSLFSVFYNENLDSYFFKFGCVMIFDNARFLKMTDKELKKMAVEMTEKYAGTHYKEETKNLISKMAFKKYKRFINSKILKKGA